MHKMHKRGALDLSIQTIVIVVIAMTLLGLGLGFVRNIFSNIGDLSESTFQRISEQLSTDLATSEAPLIFSQSRLSLERRASKIEGFGVRNDGNNPVKYGFKVETFSCPDSAKDQAGKCVDVDAWFKYFKGNEQYQLKAAERQVNRVQVDVPSDAKTGLYLLKLLAYTGNWDGTCGTPQSTCQKIGQTELFLTVN